MKHRDRDDSHSAHHARARETSPTSCSVRASPPSKLKPRAAKLTKLLQCRSCTLCRKRKIRCNRESPCSNCIRSKTPHTACVYDNLRGLPPRPKAVATPDQQPALAPRPVPATQDIVKSNSISVEEDPGYLTQKCHPEWAYENVGARPSRSPAGLTPPSQASPHDVDTMKSRIAQLEAQLSNLKSSGASPITPNTANTSVDDKLEDDESSYKELHAVFNSEIFGETQFTSRCLIHKRRLFGQSHWGNCLPLVCIIHALGFNTHITNCC